MTDAASGAGAGPARPVAVVTGAARGIGAAVAVALARAGWDLVLGDVEDPKAVAGLTYPLSDAADLAAAADAARAEGAVVATARCDVRVEDEVRALVALAGADLAAAISVAGILGADGDAWTQSVDDLERDLSVNLHGVTNLARAAVPVLIARAATDPRGRFVAVVSSAGDRGLPQLASYVASKHAALGYVRSLAADLASSGVTANAVLPGSTRTELLTRTAVTYGLDSAEGFSANQRIARLLHPEEVAEAVVWLCSEGASGVTGTTLSVDGGFTG